MRKSESISLNDKFNKLKESLKAMDRVIIAYSGGVDSAFLLKAASLSGLGRTLAITGISGSLPEEELSFARDLASSLNIDHRTVLTEELNNENYAANPPDRCYYCKKDLFSRLRRIAADEDFPFILDGTNADDTGDWRPGRRAAREEGVLSPLLEAGLTKNEIRDLSRDLGLPTWGKPATPCLSSRFPYGHRITAEALRRVNRAEQFLKKFGIEDLRVREYPDTARIEVRPRDFGILLNDEVREKIVAFLKEIGYKNITLDLQGFRSGSMNEALSSANLKDNG
ncbi:MAG: ATP-dependent sacrificial sulfur transferase LarE [Nitrospirae bacterium]|nr:ATP-dependent sacrificial sulfur transferase LarE [Nitrospirota bacterium]